MRPGIDQAWLDALSSAGIQTALMARLDFASETICVWSGSFAISVTGNTDTLLNGQTFYPIAQGIVAEVGENAYSYSGSEAFEMTLAIPDSVPQALANAAVYEAEYMARPATIWRAVMISAPGIGTPSQWLFKRIRSGQMDNLEVTNGADGQTFKLTIEAYAAAAGNTTQSTYSDQKRFDPTDTSQDNMASSMNAQPGKVASAVAYPGYGGSYSERQL